MYLVVFVSGIAVDQLVLGPNVVRAQSNVQPRASTLNFGLGKDIALGMPKGEAIKNLEDAGYNVGTSDKALVSFGRGMTVRAIGSIRFKDDTVAEITRDWGDSQEGPNVEQLWQSLWGSLTSHISDQGAYMPASVRAYTRKTPYSSLEVIDILVAPKRVVSIQKNSIELSRAPGVVTAQRGLRNFVSVDETVY